MGMAGPRITCCGMSWGACTIRAARFQIEGSIGTGRSRPGLTCGMASLAQGDNAPSFSALDDQGQRVSLSDFQGRVVVLYFYPKDDTPG